MERWARGAGLGVFWIYRIVGSVVILWHAAIVSGQVGDGAPVQLLQLVAETGSPASEHSWTRSLVM